MSSKKPFKNLTRRRQNQIVHNEEYPEEYETDYSSEEEPMEIADDISHHTGSFGGNLPEPEASFLTEVYEEFSYSESEGTDSEDSDVDSRDVEDVFLEDFAELALTHLPDYVTDKFLKILGKTKKFKKLPKTHQGLLGDIAHIPRPIEIKGGRLLHFGIRSNLLLLPSDIEYPETLNADFSHDGIRLHKSSSTSMWPIVMSFSNLPQMSVRLVSCFIGEKSQLNVNEFFHCLISELNDIHDKGSIVEVGSERKRVKFNFRLSTADTPAKTFGLGKL